MADVVINVGAVSAITAGTGLTGGTITGTGTIAASFGTTAGTICQGNDARLSTPVAPLAHASTHTAAGSDPLTLSQAQVTNLGTDLAAKVATTRQVLAGTGLGGGGALSADVTLNVSYGTSGTTACVGNDARLSNARTPSTHASSHATGGSDVLTLGQSQITSLVSDLAAKASTTHASTHATGGTDVLTLGQAQITGLVAALAAKALGATTMTAGTGLTGGGDLTANRSFAVDFGATSTTATVGNDSRLSFLAAGAGATSRTLQNKLRDVISVKDFGATGDGSTDDTVALQAALTAGTGKSVYVPAGTYNTSAALNIFANTTLYSDQGSGIINVLPTASAVTMNHGIVIYGNNVVIDGIRINGTNEGTTTAGIITAVAKGIYADAAISGSVYLSPTITNCILFQWGVGIELRRASNFVISGNRFIGGAQQGSNAADATTTDINIFGSASPNLTSRGIISNNLCYGNQDTGISFASVYDRFIICTENIIQPMAADGVTPIGSGSTNKSRYGIIASYAGGNPTGINSTISNNIITDYGHTGISSEAATRPGGDMVISGNVITNCGFSILTPGDAGLKGGIWVVGGADTINGNLILDCFRVGIQLNVNNPIDPAIQHPRPVITGNVISRISGDPNDAASSGWGMNVVGSTPNCVLITSNRIERTSNTAIRAFGSNLHIADNSILISSTNGGINIGQQGAIACSVHNNRMVNTDKTTNSGLNAGITMTGVVHCVGNVIDTFFDGILRNETITGRDISTKCSSNAINDCSVGIRCSGTGTWIVSDNTISNCITDLHTNVFQGVTVKAASVQGAGGGFKVICCDSVTPQSKTGNWAVGDRFTNSAAAVGQPKGWICTVAGNPGTWVSEGNL